MGAEVQNKKNVKIQFLRGIAIIAVVVIHTTPSGLLQVLTRPFSNFSVAMFVFLSGYLTKINILDVSKFYKKRICRVLIPYIIWILLYSIFYRDYTKIPYNLLTSKASVQFYYIQVYIQFVLITPILIKLVNSKYRNLGWLVAPVSLIIFRYIPLFYDVTLNKYLMLIRDNGLFMWFSYYYLGLILGNKLVEVKYEQKKLVFLYFASIVLQMLEGYIWLKAGEINCGSQAKITVLFTATIFILIGYNYLVSDKEIKENVINNIIILFGDCSFGIYLTHILIMEAIKKYIPAYSLLPFGINSIIVLAFSLALVIGGRKILGKKIGTILGLY